MVCWILPYLTKHVNFVELKKKTDINFVRLAFFLVTSMTNHQCLWVLRGGGNNAKLNDIGVRFYKKPSIYLCVKICLFFVGQKKKMDTCLPQKVSLIEVLNPIIKIIIPISYWGLLIPFFFAQKVSWVKMMNINYFNWTNNILFFLKIKKKTDCYKPGKFQVVTVASSQ